MSRSRHRDRRRIGGPVAAVVAGLALVVAAVVVRADHPGRHAPAPVVAADRGRLPGPTTTEPSVADSGGADRAPQQHGTVPAGTRLVLAGQGVDAAVEPVRAPGGVMQVPPDPRRIGWWRDGAAPGDPAGTAVLVGHVDYAGVEGALSVLPRLRPGAVVRLREPRRTLSYRVQATRVYPKTRGLPPALFTRTGRPLLALVSCGGPFDAASGNYLDNVVVYAVPVSGT